MVLFKRPAAVSFVSFNDPGEREAQRERGGVGLKGVGGVKERKEEGGFVRKVERS